MNVLFVTTVLLSKNCNGGEVASQSLVDALEQNGHHVVVVGYLRKGDSLRHCAEKEIVVKERTTETNNAWLSPVVWLLLSAVRKMPYSVAKYYSYAYRRVIKKLVGSWKYDVVIIDHAQLGWLRHIVMGAGPIVAVAHNIEHQNYLEYSTNATNPILGWLFTREARLLKAQEDSLAAAADEVWAFTQHDADYFSALDGKIKVRVLPLTPTLGEVLDGPVKKEFDIGLLGSWSWQSNQHAMEWFLKSVYPHLPLNLSIHVAGKGAEPLLGNRANIHYHGVVPHAQRFMAQARVVAIPSLGGGGIQIKTLDAIASGSAIVATPAALRGISTPPGTVEMTEEPIKFANLLVSLAASGGIGDAAFYEAREWHAARRQQLVEDIGYAIGQYRNP